MGLVAVDHWRDEEQVCQTSWPVTNQSIKCLFLEVFQVCGWPPREATTVT